MEELKFNSNGSDALYLANANAFFTALFQLDIFRNQWRDDKLGSQSALQNTLDWYQQKYHGGRTGNRLDIAARNAARKALNDKIQMILHYVAIFADESDITLLLNSNVVTKKTRTRARKSAKPAVAS